MYIFVQKGLSPEQVAVQAAHAAYEVPRNFQVECEGLYYHPHLVLISPNISMNDVRLILDGIDLPYAVFYDEDYLTLTVATLPIPEDSWQRQALGEFKTLRFHTSKPEIKY